MNISTPSPVVGARNSQAALARKLAALAHPARIEILRHLSCVECCCCNDVVERLELAQSTVSQHLKVLVEAGLVRLTPDRQRSRYEIDRAALAGFAASVGRLLDACCAGCPTDTAC